ncbi:MAG: hypothetical protein JWO03_1340 [Bacteroidetes bacterium]|nr:hypothetical protein [Bacteroidota bacterium]
MSHNPNTRLEFFCDGIFAIAITLLVIEIKVPHAEHIHSPADLWHELARLWPSYFAFLFSFGAVLVSWINHNSFFSMIHKSSRQFYYSNGFFMLSIAFLPFPTAVLAEYIGTPYAGPAISFYCLFSVLGSIAWHVLYYSARYPQNLFDESFNDFSKDTRGLHMGLLIYLFTFILSIWFPYIALLINLLLWFLWIGISLTEPLSKSTETPKQAD